MSRRTASHEAHFTLFPTALGTCGIAWRGEVIVATRLPDAHPDRTARALAARIGAVEAAPPPPIRSAIAGMTALLDGEGTDLTALPCDFSGCDTLAAAVYAEARSIQAGRTSTYGEIAGRLGDKALARQVGQALGRNPLPIVVPCHRVLGAGGTLTGFSAAGGVATKLRMLAIEGASIGAAPTLFDDLPLQAKKPH